MMRAVGGRWSRAALAQLGSAIMAWEFTSKGITCARAETYREVSADRRGCGELAPHGLSVLHRVEARFLTYHPL